MCFERLFRQFEPEHRAVCIGVLHLEQAVVNLHCIRADRQADTAASITAAALLKDMRQQVGRNAAAGVAHTQAHPLALVRNAVGDHAVLRVTVGIDRQD